MAYIKGPEYLNDLHGIIKIPIPPPLRFNGGVFGGPRIPTNREGVYATHWSLPVRYWQDGGPSDPFRAVRAGTQPVAGLGDTTDALAAQVTYHNARAGFWKLVAMGLGGWLAYDKIKGRIRK